MTKKLNMKGFGFGSDNEIKKFIGLEKLSEDQIVNKAIYYHSKGKIELAERYYKYCIENNINDERIFSNYAMILRNSGKLKDAETIIKKYILINPLSIISYNNLSGILRESGRLKDAENALKKCLEIKNDNWESLYNFGCLLIDQKKYEEAKFIFKKSISINSSNSNAYLNLGIVMRNLGEFNESLENIKKAIEIKPNNALCFLNLGIVYKELKDYKLGMDCFNKALELNSRLTSIKYELTTCKGLICDWENNLEMESWKINLGLSGESCNPLDFYLYDDNPLNHLKRSQNFFNQNYKRKEIKIIPQKHKIIRVGYLSADFQENHPIMNLLPYIIESHDRTKFEIYVYSFTQIKKRCTNFLESHSDVFRDILNLNEEETIKTIREDNLDIAIDLMGYTSKNRAFIFSNRIAATQINFLGFPGTMGSKIYDYIISDEIIIPHGFEKYYEEKVLRLSHFFPPNMKAINETREKVSREDFDLPENAFVFTCFNQNKKITQKEFDIWMKLLCEIRDSVLWLQKSNDSSELNLKKEAIKRNINPKRIIFTKRISSFRRHLSRYSIADLALDTFNYNGHTTTSDALCSGLPVLTKIGKSFSARVSASILSSINLKELIATDEKDYENKALYLANNRNEINRIRKLLHSAKKDPCLSNSKKYTSELENIFIEIHSKNLLD